MKTNTMKANLRDKKRQITVWAVINLFTTEENEANKKAI